MAKNWSLKKWVVLWLILLTSSCKTRNTIIKWDSCTPSTAGTIALMGEVNGNITTGIVFLCDNEEWKAVCDENWDVNDASVVCQELGLSNDGAKSRGESCDGTKIGIVKGVSYFTCLGNETRLMECHHEPRISCDWKHCAGVLCTLVTKDACSSNCENSSTARPDADGSNITTATHQIKHKDTVIAILGAISATLLIALVGAVIGWVWSCRGKSFLGSHLSFLSKRRGQSASEMPHYSTLHHN